MKLKRCVSEWVGDGYVLERDENPYQFYGETTKRKFIGDCREIFGAFEQGEVEVGEEWQDCFAFCDKTFPYF